MERLRRSTFTIVGTVLCGLGFLVWTLWMPTAVNGLWSFGIPSPDSAFGQIMIIMAGATAPIVLAVVAVVASMMLSRRRFFVVSGVALLTWVLAWSAAKVVKELAAVARPDSPYLDTITQSGYSYPSGHVTVWAAMAVLATTIASTMRRPLLPVAAASWAGVLLVAANRLILGAHTITDVVGGLLLGGFVASLANLITDVHVVRNAKSGEDLAAAVIYNPVKVVGVEIFRDLVAKTLTEHGYEKVLWLSTEAEDPGFAMARRALDADVDVILVAGGDGTVRIVLGELAGTGQKVAILPSGTGNLLARNLDIPLDVERALTLALEHDPTPTDIIEVRHGDHTEYAAVLAGIGLDADIMGDTDEDLKKSIGPAAYVIAGASHLDAKPMQVTITVDDADPVEADASLVSVGNVGELQKGVSIMPDASAHDGRLDVLVATPHSRLEMAQMVTDLITDNTDGTNIARYTGKRVRLQIEEPAPAQIDGDVIDDVTDITFEVKPGDVQLVLP